MKRLILCFDGTWNTLSDPTVVTNVVKVADAVNLRDPEGVHQICYYNSGVGSGGPIDRITGGVFGAGLKNNVKRGLAFLTQNYDAGGNGEEPDEIYLFGFSRGAYTARAVAGVLGAVGIPWEVRDSEVHWETYRKIAKLRSKQRDLDPKSRRYQRLDEKIQEIQNPKDATAAEGKTVNKPKTHTPESIKVKCIGVFDTVGSYGIPAGLGLGALPHVFTYWTRGFHSRKISDRVDVALHAMAIDEMRRPFAPTFWTRKPDDKVVDGQVVEQVWFPGVHCNIGGGYEDTRLSDMALAWMISKVQKHTKLNFNRKTIEEEVWPCSAGMVYRTSKGGWFSKARTILPAIQEMVKPDPKLRIRLNEAVHWSVKERYRFEKAPMEGLGFTKYAPGNLKTETYSKPTRLEQELCSPTREWLPDKCPLKGAGLPCECKTSAPKYFAEGRNEPQRDAA